MQNWLRLLTCLVGLVSAQRAAQAQTTQIGVPETTLPSMSQTGGLDAVPASDSAPTAYAGSGKTVPPRGQLVIAPIPFASPSLGVGIVPVLDYVFSVNRNDRVSPPSSLVLAGFGTSSGSWGFGGGASLNWKKDRLRTTIFGAYARLKYDVFGLGTSAGNAGRSIPVRQKIQGIYAQQLVQIWSGLYVGPRFIRANAASTFELSGVVPPSLDPVLGDFDVPIVITSLGFNVQHDKRDSIHYPHKGHLYQFTADYYSPELGSDRAFNRYQAGVNEYIPFGENNTLALRAAGCGVTGSHVPFFTYCQFGQQGDNRGYESGRYRDVAMFSTQAEWRMIIHKRFGGTAFIGVGEVAPDGGSFNFANLLPSGGLGLRFNLLKDGRMNLRADGAYSLTGFSWSMGIGEVF